MTYVTDFGGTSLCRAETLTYSEFPKYTAVITQEDGWYLGWVEEVPGANAHD